MRVLVCGGRDFQDYMLFVRAMKGVETEHGPIKTVIHGAAPGADWCAHLYATGALKREELAFPADWEAHGRAAGPIRNQRMLVDGKPDIVVAFPGGRGTADMVRKARAAGVRVVEVSP